MRHLKTYKIFEDYGIKQEVGDLIANLTDDGYHTTITERPTNGYHFLIITIDKRVESNKSYISPEDLTTFPWIEVRPEIQRMVDYLKDRYFLHKTKLYKSIDRYASSMGDMFTFDYVIPMVGTDNLNIKKVEMTFIKEEVNESKDEMNWFSNITETIEDILLDLEDVGFKTSVDIGVSTPSPRTTGYNRYEIEIDISRGNRTRFIESDEQLVELESALLRIKDYMSSNHKDWLLKDDYNGNSIFQLISEYNSKSTSRNAIKMAKRRLNLISNKIQLLGVDMPELRIKFIRK